MKYRYIIDNKGKGIKYRPFKDSYECWITMLQHQPFGWVKHLDGKYLNLTEIDDLGVNISSEISDARYASFSITDHLFTFTQVFNIYNFIDGTPFGIGG